ncbi:MAG: DNA-directed RNA polymerase subunit omega [Clostridia bacterium]|nr:DNA-directed RNA polymerase subunit omega [Clostridia bacterium]
MLYPEISKLMEGMTSRYSLVIATAKRARQIAEQGTVNSEGEADRAVSEAVNEIAQGIVTCKETGK